MALAPPPPQTLVVFGASGDLARHKLFRRCTTWRTKAFCPSVTRSSERAVAALRMLNSASTPAGASRSSPATDWMRHAGNGARVVLEKPIGHDLASARDLAQVVGGVFDESRVFRIDRYVGKEAVQNILVFRFANSMVERAWSGEAVDHVQITVAEAGGIAGRGRYYEEAGALRDMVQNHLLQVLASVAMEPPDSLAPEDVRDRKAELLEAVRPLSPDALVKGQYVAGVVEGRESPSAPSSSRSAPGTTSVTGPTCTASGEPRWRR